VSTIETDRRMSAEIVLSRKIGAHRGKTFYRKVQVKTKFSGVVEVEVGDGVLQVKDPAISSSLYVHRIVAIVEDKDTHDIDVFGVFYRSARDTCVRSYKKNGSKEVLLSNVYEPVPLANILGKVHILPDRNQISKEDEVYQHRFILEGTEDHEGYCDAFSPKGLPEEWKPVFALPQYDDLEEIWKRVYSEDSSQPQNDDSSNDNNNDNNNSNNSSSKLLKEPTPQLPPPKNTNKRKSEDKEAELEESASKPNKKIAPNKSDGKKNGESNNKSKPPPKAEKSNNKTHSDSTPSNHNSGDINVDEIPAGERSELNAKIVTAFAKAFKKFPQKEVLQSLPASHFAVVFSIASKYMHLLNTLNSKMEYEL